MHTLFQFLAIFSALSVFVVIRHYFVSQINETSSDIISFLREKLASAHKMLDEDTTLISTLNDIVVAHRAENDKLRAINAAQSDALAKLQKLVFELSPETEKLFNKVKLNIN